jgi:predicted phosphohydrolase
MNIFAISDLHLSGSVDKPMHIFGSNWDGHWANIKKNWTESISGDDVVVVPGDISWAMNMQEAYQDIQDLAALPGKKLIIKGNHDFWWSSITKVRSILPESIHAIQNDAIRINGFVFAGTRGWSVPGMQALSREDEKIYLRESQRLQLSLRDAKKIMQPGDKLVVMMHYPPFSMELKSSLFTEILEQVIPNIVVYGHLHGVSEDRVYDGMLRGVRYRMTSCDYIGFSPVLLDV